MKKFLLLITFVAKTQAITGKPIDDTGWEDLLILFGDDEWVDRFDQLMAMFG